MKKKLFYFVHDCRHFYYKLQKVMENVRYVLPGTVYFIHWSRDCDMCEGSRAVRVFNEKAYQAYIEKAYEWAEGPNTFERIGKEEYENFHGFTRDRIMEAYENGNGNSIYV